MIERRQGYMSSQDNPAAKRIKEILLRRCGLYVGELIAQEIVDAVLDTGDGSFTFEQQIYVDIPDDYQEKLRAERLRRIAWDTISQGLLLTRMPTETIETGMFSTCIVRLTGPVRKALPIKIVPDRQGVDW